MSSSRGTKGEVSWSPCSAAQFGRVKAECLNDVPQLSVFDNQPFKGEDEQLPGHRITIHDQCKFYAKDELARASPINQPSNICNFTLYCESPKRVGFFAVGPALDGTYCGEGMHCRNGLCVRQSNQGAQIRGLYGPWEQDSINCASECLVGSMGAKTYSRHCNAPKPHNTLRYCDGPSKKIELCDDMEACSKEPMKPRRTAEQYATEMCQLYSQQLSFLARPASGRQMDHDPMRPGWSCAIFCKVNDQMWYSPRFEMNEASDKWASFFPDGTLCHQDLENGPYYCRNHVCLPSKPLSYPLNGSSSDGLILAESELRGLNMSNPDDIRKVQNYYSAFIP